MSFSLAWATGRADQSGRLRCEFDQMAREPQTEREIALNFRLARRQTAADVSSRDPGSSGVEKKLPSCSLICVRGRPLRARRRPAEIVKVMNDFFRVSVCAVEEEHCGMVNKYLGYGFMAIFGAGDSDRIMPAMLRRRGAKFCARLKV